jgi:hypothetical protein
MGWIREINTNRLSPISLSDLTISWEASWVGGRRMKRQAKNT